MIAALFFSEFYFLLIENKKRVNWEKDFSKMKRRTFTMNCTHCKEYEYVLVFYHIISVIQQFSLLSHKCVLTMILCCFANQYILLFLNLISLTLVWLKHMNKVKNMQEMKFYCAKPFYYEILILIHKIFTTVE